MRNVLALYLRKSILTFQDALRIQAELEELLKDREYEASSADILTLVNGSNCSAYDCEFVALAKGFNTKLVTMDKKIVQVFPETAISLIEYID